MGGPLVTAPEATAVSGAFENGRYGLGIVISPDQTLWHYGSTGGFRTDFRVSTDRTWSVVVACNSVGLDRSDVAGPLEEIWVPG